MVEALVSRVVGTVIRHIQTVPVSKSTEILQGSLGGAVCRLT